jgi:hypothetical protein
MMKDCVLTLLAAKYSRAKATPLFGCGVAPNATTVQWRQASGRMRPMGLNCSFSDSVAGKKTEPGVYRSDKEGHLLHLKLNPTRVACIVCMDSVNCDAYKIGDELVKVVNKFTDTHGYLNGKIADSILQLIPTSNEPKQ